MNSSQWVILLFGLLYFGFILFTRRKGDFEEFSVASRGLGFFLVFSSICASFIGPGWTLGLVREGFSTGLFMAVLIPLSGIGLIIVGILIVPRIRNKFTDIYSIGDLIGGKNGHNHRLVQLAVGITSLMFFGSVTVAMSYAGGELINNVFGFSRTWSIVIVTTVVILYSFFGGIRATIQTDAIQFVHFIILIPILAFLLLTSDAFDWSDYSKAVEIKTSSEFNAQSSVAIFSLLLLWLLSATALDAGGLARVLASKNNRVAKNSFIASGVFLIFWMVAMIFIGSVGFYLYPEFGNDDQLLLHIAFQHFPGVLYGIFIVAMIGVVMSSQDTCLNAGSILFSEDIMGAIRPITAKQKLLYAKIYTIVMGLICIVMASYLSSILQVIMIVTEYYIPVMIPVIIFSIFKKTCHWQSALTSMLSGLLSYQICRQYFSDILPELFTALVFSTFSYLLSDYVLHNKYRKQFVNNQL